MINRRSVPALHRACLHHRWQPRHDSGWDFTSGTLENGHDSGVSRCDNAGQSNCGKDGTEHLNSPVLAYQAGKFDGPNLSRAVRHLYETLHTSNAYALAVT